MKKKLETDDEPLKKPNRRKKLRSPKVKVWCFSCDGRQVQPGTKCPTCGYIWKRKIRYD